MVNNHPIALSLALEWRHRVIVNHKMFGNICFYIEGATGFQLFAKKDRYLGSIHPEQMDPYRYTDTGQDNQLTAGRQKLPITIFTVTIIGVILNFYLSQIEMSRVWTF